MKNQDHENALARALDLLDAGDPARSDPRLLRDPHLVAEARAIRETAADVWLAVSPLRAAPSGMLESVLAGISTPTSRRWKWLPAASGWAAAAAVALAWLFSQSQDEIAPAEITGRTTSKDPAPVDTSPSPVTDAVPRGTRSPAEDLRRELIRLRHALAKEQDSKQGTIRPKVIELAAPGTPPRDPAETRERVLDALANALRGTLEAQSADPAALVIERGWFTHGQIHLSDGETIRHKNFPVENAADFGLLESGDGNFYDPASGLVWSPEPGSTDYTGRTTEPDEDMSAYRAPEEKEETPPSAPAPSAGPSGFIVQDTTTGETQLVIDGLAPLADGSTYWLNTSGAAGATTYPITYQPNSAGNFTGVFSSGPMSLGNGTSFELVQVRESSLPGGTTQTVILTGEN